MSLQVHKGASEQWDRARTVVGVPARDCRPSARAAVLSFCPSHSGVGGGHFP